MLVERILYLVSDASSASMPSNARLALFGLIGVLVVILAVLVVFAFVIRKRAAPEEGSEPASDSFDDTPEVGDLPEEDALLASSAPEAPAVGAGLDAGGAEIVACPTCRREYETKLQYCPHDARRLVPASEILDTARKLGSICPRCHRAFDPGMRFCPHDAAELVPSPIYRATRARRATTRPTGVVAKICPQCGRRHDLSETFCGKDGSELVIIN